MPLPNGIIKKDESVYWAGKGEFLLFVPDFYFDMKLAVITGEFVSVLGVLNYAISTDSNTYGKIRQFYFPSMFTTKPGYIEKIKNFEITECYKADYRVFHYTNNNIDQVISSTKISKEIGNVEDLFRLFYKTGKTPNTVMYDEMQNYPMSSIEVAGSSFGINIGLFGIVQGELCRDPEDLSKPFRLSSTIDKNMCGYKEISLSDAPKYVSPYASLTSENFDSGVIGAVMSKPKSPSALEKVFTG